MKTDWEMEKLTVIVEYGAWKNKVSFLDRFLVNSKLSVVFPGWFSWEAAMLWSCSCQ